MTQFKSTLACAVAMTMFGCASTSQPDRTDYPTLTVLNPTPYVWDDKKSLALNVANMAEPAGVGIGLEDSSKASDASTGRSTGAARLFGTVLMGVSQGAYGVVSDQVLTNKAEAALKWKPALVDLIPVSEIGTNLTPKSFLKLRTVIGERVVSSLKQSQPDLSLLVTYTPKVLSYKNNTFYAFSGSGCHESMKFHSYEPENAPKFIGKDLSTSMLERIDFPKEYCDFSTKLTIAGTIKRGGIDHYIVVSEVRTGFSFINHLKQNYPGYILLPEVFDVPLYDKPISVQKSLYPHAVVFADGKPQPFVTP